MNYLAETALRKSKNGIFTFGDVTNWLPESSRAAVYAHIQRALKTGEVVQVRRGLYHLSREVYPKLVSTYVLANMIYGPSYVSFEAALSYYDWIPEAVRNIQCVTNVRPKVFETIHGNFSYVMVKQTPMMAGVTCRDDGHGSFLMASPLKALADLVACRGLDWTSCHPLIHSLRIEEEDLETLTGEDFDCLDGVYYSKRARTFLAGVRKDLKV